MDDKFMLEMPIFKPEYKKWIKYGYKNTKEKNNLKKVLEKCSHGYCMYCYSRVIVDGKSYSNLEHAIEKSNSDILIECIPNIGIACSACNQSFKKAGEKNRKLSYENVRKFEKQSICSVEKRKQCTTACKALKELKDKYNALQGGKIILQPMGVKGEDTSEKLNLQYNVLKMEFEPALANHQYSEKEIDFINLHIKRFRLNDPQYRSRALFEYIRSIIDNNGKVQHYEYNNMIVEQFRNSLEGKSDSEILKICKGIFGIVFAKM